MTHSPRHAFSALLPFVAFALTASPAARAQDCWRSDALESGGGASTLVQEGQYTALTLNLGGAGSVGDHTDRYRIVLPAHARLTLALDLQRPSSPMTNGAPEFIGSFQVGGEPSREYRIGGHDQHEDAYPPVLENATNSAIDVEFEVGSPLLSEYGCIEYSMLVDLDRRPCDVLNEDALEGPDDCATALVLAPGTYSDLVVFGAGRQLGEDADAYRVPNVLPGESVRVTVRPLDASNDRLFARLTDDASCRGNPSIAGILFERNETGSVADYYLRLESESPWDFVRYELLVERLPDACAALQPDAFEPNDLCTTAAVLTAGAHSGLTLDEAGDLFEVAVPAHHTLRVRASSTDPDLVPLLGISGTTSCPSNFEAQELSHAVHATAETLRIGVLAQDVRCGTYDLRVELVPDPCTTAAGDGLHEPNDTCATAAGVPLVLASDGDSAGELRTSASDLDDDYYRVTVPAGGFLSVAVIGGVELTAFPAAHCGATPLRGTSTGPTSVATLLPARESAAVDYILGVTVPSGTVGCVPYVLQLHLGGCGFIPLSSDGAWWAPQVSDCNAPIAVTSGVFNDLVLRPAETTVCAIDVPSGGSLDVSLDASDLQNSVGAPVMVALHDGAGDCVASGASLSSAVFVPGDPNPSLVWINHGIDRTVYVEFGFAPGVSYCGALDVTFDLATGDPFTADCLPAPLNRVPCPCGNDAVLASGGGCANSTGNSGRQSATGSAKVALDDFRPLVTGLAAEAPGILLRRSFEPFAQAHPFYDGVLCIGSAPEVVARFVTDASGTWQGANPLAGALGVAPGAVDRFQVWYRDPAGPCGSGANTTNSIRVDWE